MGAGPGAGDSLADVLKRAHALLSYVESAAQSLLEEADPAGWRRARAAAARAQAQAQAAAPGAASATSATSATSAPAAETVAADDDAEEGEEGEGGVEGLGLGGAWGAELRALSWIPVLVAAPRGAAGLPWPPRVHSSALAAPSQVRLWPAWKCVFLVRGGPLTSRLANPS